MLTFLLVSCSATVVIDDDQPITLNDLLHDYEIWYLDIERTQGNGEVPFLQKAFTISFRNGTFYANNNLVGMGSNGNGFGLDVGFFNTNLMELTIDHDIDGLYDFRVTQLGDNNIELFNARTNTSYHLIGYQRNTFDYDQVFNDNIHYFLQEYEVWEKRFTSQEGVLNEFDEENFIQFLPFGSGDNFKSSKDQIGTDIEILFYDYLGHYEVDTIVGNNAVKKLTLDYDYLGNESFELSVINDRRIRLYHPVSGTTYEFVGLNLIQYKNAEKIKSRQNERKRISITTFKKLTK